MRKVIAFSVRGQYAHFKKIYATTSAVSYMIPPKTTIYGYISAILGFEKDEYLTHFQDKKCLIGLQICKPIIMQRINTNLRPVLGRLSETGNRKPTTIEYVYEPHYIFYISHSDLDLMKELEERLDKKSSVFTPTLGLANMLSVFEFKGTFDVEEQSTSEIILVHSVIPNKKFVKLDEQAFLNNQNHIVEQSLFAIEMDLDRNVTERDDIILDRSAQPIKAVVTNFYTIQNENIILF